jgi:hypothetical protein
MNNFLGSSLESPFLYVLTNIFVWVGVAGSIEMFVLSGNIIDGVLLGVVGGFIYGVGNILFKY